MEEVILRFDNLDFEMKKCEEMIRAFLEYPKISTILNPFHRVLYFPNYGYYALTVYTTEEVTPAYAKEILDKELEAFPDYRFNNDELIITLDDSDEEVMEIFSEDCVSDVKNLFARLFYQSYLLLTSSYTKEVDRIEKSEFLTLIEKMRQDIWNVVFEGEILPDGWGYEVPEAEEDEIL